MRDGSPNALQIVALIFSVLAAIGILVIAPAIYLFNRPKCFVPPHLRDQPGFVEERRGRSGPAH